MALLLIPDAMFQSTHLLRGATSSHTWFSSVDPFQSTHLLRGATDCRYPIRIQFHVSIHAPLARCDVGYIDTWLGLHEFQSTHLLRGATHPYENSNSTRMSFNPRTSCEVRLMAVLKIKSSTGFQSTHLLRGATRCCSNSPVSASSFQSTHLLRGATDERPGWIDMCSVSIHAPLARCDSKRTYL